MDEKIWYLLIAILFLALQFVFRADARKIIDSMTEKVDSGIKSFDAHVVEATEMHTMIEKLEKSHSVLDSEGRPMWYMPPSMISTQKDIVQIIQILAENQKATVKILERLERKIDKE